MTPTLTYLIARTSTPLMDCMIWNGTTERGYGRLQIEGRWHKVHRLAWEFKHGPIPDGYVIDHLCRVRGCINTDHMELVSPAENNRRAAPFRVGLPHIPGKAATECRNGHPYPADSPPVGKGGTRCKVCAVAGRRRRAERAKAARQKQPDSPGG